MKTYAELKEEYSRNSAEIIEIEDFFRGESRTRLIAITGGRLLRKGELTEEQKKALDELGREEKEKNDRLNVLKVAQRVLYENIRQAFFVETMPTSMNTFPKISLRSFWMLCCRKSRLVRSPCFARMLS